MSIEPEPLEPPPPSLPVEVILRSPNGDVEKSSESIASLEERLEKSLDQRKEERFVWACVTVMFADMAMFQHLGWIQAILIAILQAFVLLVLANMWGLEHAQLLLSRLWGSCMNWIEHGRKPKSD